MCSDVFFNCQLNPISTLIVLFSATSYHVALKTGDVREAGTDANVFVQIYGEQGDTGKLHLRTAENTKNKFERGRTDQFVLEAVDIGKVGIHRSGRHSTVISHFSERIRIMFGRATCLSHIVA